VGFREVFTKNIGWKIWGVVLALALWFHLATEKVYEKEFSVDIIAFGLRDDLRVDKFVPPTATIIVTGTGKQLLKLAIFDEVKLIADLSSFKSPGNFVQKFRVDNLAPFDPSQYRKVDISGNGIFDIHIVAN